MLANLALFTILCQSIAVISSETCNAFGVYISFSFLKEESSTLSQEPKQSLVFFTYFKMCVSVVDNVVLLWFCLGFFIVKYYSYSGTSEAILIHTCQ